MLLRSGLRWFDQNDDYVGRRQVPQTVAVNGCETPRCGFMRPLGAAQVAPL